MTPEALRRLREAVRVYDADVMDEDPVVDFDDLRALLDERDTLRAQVERVRKEAEYVLERWSGWPRAAKVVAENVLGTLEGE